MPVTQDKMFGDDSFSGIEDLFNQLAGVRRESYRNTRTHTQSLLNTVEFRKETILIFDLSGKKVNSVRIVDDLETNDYGERLATGQKVLAIEFEGSEILKYNLPKALAKRKVNYTFKNGILEVSLKK